MISRSLKDLALARMAAFDPFQHEFFIRGLIAATTVGALCGLVGVYVTLRKMSYIGHGLAHAVFGGAVVSYIMSFNFYVGASLWGFLSVILINLTTRYRQFIAADAAIGVVTTGSFALGVALVSHYKTFTRSFDAALFGNVLGVTDTDLVAITVVTATAFLVIIIIYRQLLFTTFNSEVASLHGIRTSRIDALFSLILAGTIVVSIQVMGVTLIAAAIVVPPITARLLTNSFNSVVVLSVMIGALAGLVGMYVSFFVDVSSGANIVLTTVIFFLLAMLYSSFNGRLRNLCQSTLAEVPRSESGVQQ